MRKSTIFISAVLTTFALAMLYGVVSAYRNSLAPLQSPSLPPTTASVRPTTEPTQTAAMITLEQAAQLAAQVVGNTNLLSAETSTFNGLDAYLVTFTNNDFVYVGLDGQILGVQVAPVMVSAAPPVRVSNNHSGSSDGDESHEDDDDHAEREDEDDREEHEDEDDDD